MKEVFYLMMLPVDTLYSTGGRWISRNVNTQPVSVALLTGFFISCDMNG
jgi:hypothetical protein